MLWRSEIRYWILSWNIFHRLFFMFQLPLRRAHLVCAQNFLDNQNFLLPDIQNLAVPEGKGFYFFRRSCVRAKAMTPYDMISIYLNCCTIFQHYHYFEKMFLRYKNKLSNDTDYRATILALIWGWYVMKQNSVI